MNGAPFDLAGFLLTLNSLLLDATDPAVLRKTLPTYLVGHPGICGAWLGQVDEHQTFIMEGSAGPAVQAYLAQVRIQVGEGPLAQGAAGQAWRSGETTIADCISDSSMSPWQAARDAVAGQWKSVACIPLRTHDHYRLGLLSIYAQDADFFTREEGISLTRHLQTLVGRALGRLAQRHREQRIQRLYASLLSQGKPLLARNDENVLLANFCKRLVKTKVLSNAWVGVPDGTVTRMVVGAGLAITNPPIHLPCGPNDIITTALTTGHLQLSNDCMEDARFTLWPDPLLHNVRAIAICAIRRAGTLWGTLTLGAPSVEAFDRSLLRFTLRLARFIGGLLDELDNRIRLQAEQTRQAWLAQHDALTGLPNRSILPLYLDGAMARARRHDRLLAIGMLDLDDFKPINDMHGHEQGDRVLQTLATRLRDAVRAQDLVARMGGDEFAFILENIAQMEDVERIMDRVAQALEEPFLLANGAPVFVRASVGLTLYPFDDGQRDMLLRHADQALYSSKMEKTKRKRFWRCFQPEIVTPQAWQDDFPQNAVAFFQPCLSLREGRITSIEALARVWDGNRFLSPTEFLPLLPRNERRTLSQAMLTQGLALLNQLDATGHTLSLSFNVDPEFLVDQECAPCLTEVVAKSGIDPQRITVEILESGEFLSLPIAKIRMASIKSTGVRIALDDIGSAYSSLLRLKELPIDEIKLDQAFVRDFASHPEHLVFVQTIQALALGLNATLVVEGVETAEILDAMIALRIDTVQGYYVAKPMRAETFLPWLTGFIPPQTDLLPHTLLGAYAGHLAYHDTLRRLLISGGPPALRLLPLLPTCPLTQFLTRTKGDGSPVGLLHSEALHRTALLPTTTLNQAISTLAEDEAQLLAAIRNTLNDPPK